MLKNRSFSDNAAHNSSEQSVLLDNVRVTPDFFLLNLTPVIRWS